MNLESQVAPLVLALRMKELGFPQDTGLEWYKDEGAVIHRRVGIGGHATGGWSIRLCAAPTVAEMGEWFEPGSEPKRVRGQTEAESRARLLIALAEAGAIKTEALR